MTVSGERSKYFGPDGQWTFSGNGTTFDNLDADVYFKWAIEQRIVPDLLKQPPPLGPKRGVRKGVAGYVKGYNAYLEKVGRRPAPRPRLPRRRRGFGRSRRSTSTGASSSSGSSPAPAR